MESKPILTKVDRPILLCFNSLQTGRSMERLSRVTASWVGETEVSIPFKREGAWKVEERYFHDVVRLSVSIPFKREGAWKVNR